MKELCKKASRVCKQIFGYGMLVTLFAGGFTFFGYVAALCIGGDAAVAICTFLYKTVIPVITYATSILVLLGLVAMYLAGEKALTPDKPAKRS